MDIQPKPDVLFHEEQKSDQWWLWAGTAAWEAVAAWRLAGTIRHRRPVGGALETVSIALGAAMAAAVPVLLATAKLTTEVRPDGLFIKYSPFHRSFQRVPLEDAVKVSVVTYSPLLQYGGWGIRYSLTGKAFNPKGNRGVRIDYTNGSHILIGSQRPEELAARIEEIRPSVALSVAA